MKHRSATGPKEALLLAFAAAQLGCVADVGSGEELDPSSEEPVASASYALSGAINFDDGSCRPFGATFMEDKLRTGIVLARLQLFNPLLVQCMENAFLSFNRHSFVERFIEQMKEDVTTVVRCKDLSSVGASMQVPPVWPSDLPPGTTEYVEVHNGFAQFGSAIDAGALFLHEVAHTKGFVHPNQPNSSPTLAFFDAPDHRFSVPQQFLMCSLSLSNGAAVPAPNGIRRDALSPATTLTPVGGAGGSAFERICTSGNAIATGLEVRAGAWIDALGLTCLATPHTPLVGNLSGGTRNDSNCNASTERLVGVEGTTTGDGTVLSSIEPLCATTTSIQAGTRNEANLRRPGRRGTNTGIPFRRWCPAGMVVNGMRGRAGSLIDRLEIDCVNLNNASTILQGSLQQVGGNGGQANIHKCAGQSAITALHFMTGSLTINRLGAECNSVAKACAATTCAETIGAGLVSLIPGEGGGDGLVGRKDCPAGQALVGMDLWSNGAVINAIEGFCATPGSTVLTATGAVGFTDFVLRTQLRCPAGFLMTGWTVRTGALVDSVHPICRNF